MPRVFIVRLQRRIVEGFVKVLDDIGRFDPHLAVMHQHGHQPVRIDAEEIGRDVLALARIEMVAGPS